MDVRALTDWLARILLAGGFLLLVVRLAMALTPQPVRQIRLGECGMIAALVLAVLSLLPLPTSVFVFATPAYSVLDIDEPQTRSAKPPTATALQDGYAADGPREAAPTSTYSTSPDPALPADNRLGGWQGWLLTMYATGGVVLFARGLLGYLALWRLLRRARRASAALEEAFQQLARGRRPVRLLVAEGVRAPFSCGVLQPAIVLPTRFVAEACEAKLRWVLYHELTHIDGRDARTCLLTGLVQIVYYPVPWLWSVCRQMRLCQEFVADAAAAAASGCAEDYAQFLLGWAAVSSPSPLVAGVSGRSSDLYRRVAMLLKSPISIERRCSHRFTLCVVCGLSAIVLLGAGVGRKAAAGAADDPKKVEKEEPKKPEPGNDAPERQTTPRPHGMPGLNLQELLRQSGLSDEQFRALLEQLPADNALKDLMQERDRLLQELRGLTGDASGPGSGRSKAVARRPEGRLGISVSPPGATLAAQLDLPKGQGLAIDDVRSESAAAKAGMKRHDILLELDGKPVSSDIGEFLKSLAAIPADKVIDAVVLRRGRRETVKGLALPEPPEVRWGFGFGARGPAGLPGVPGAGAIGGIGGGMIGGFGRGAGAGFGLPNAGAFGPDGRVDLGVPLAGAKGVMTTTFRSDDRFTTRHQEGSLVITVSGTVENGRASVSEIRVQDGQESHKYDSTDKLPEAYRDKVKRLTDLASKDNSQYRIREFDGLRPAK
jgi:beta-lactamase regulating signal transducer with metallopeptidase domain